MSMTSTSATSGNGTTAISAAQHGEPIRLTTGLNLPIAGQPREDVVEHKAVHTVALLADDYLGLKSSLAVNEGDVVTAGQELFSDKRFAGVKYVSPAAGKVVAIHRAEKRRFVSVVVQVEGDEQTKYRSHADSDLTGLGRDAVRDALTNGGLWPAFRTRPYSKVADPATVPHSIFVTAMDTNPLAADPKPLIKQRGDEFVYGLQAIRQLTDGPVYLCCDVGANLPGADLEGVAVKEFAGPHPAGLVGTHIHFIDPVGERKTVWHLTYADVIDIGSFLVTGRTPTERVVSLAGPMVRNPRLLRTNIGASLEELTAGELNDGPVRVISGSVLSGRWAKGHEAYLGRYALQISAIREAGEREFLGWQGPGFQKFSIRRIFASAMTPGRPFSFTTTTGGSARSMVPIGMYEEVMPLDIIPTFLLRALATHDTEAAQQLGALELDEEDLALCTFVDPGKGAWGPILRRCLTQIEREG